ncbi:hypothetical protein HUJ04_000547, partial [Dendroctonus ponderosae]
MDNIFVFKQIIENEIVTNREIDLLFIDLQKSYDSIPISKPWKVLEETKINHMLINPMKELYKGERNNKRGHYEKTTKMIRPCPKNAQKKTTENSNGMGFYRKKEKRKAYKIVERRHKESISEKTSRLQTVTVVHNGGKVE